LRLLIHHEQLLAIAKPKSLSSAQVLRDLQKVFNPSKVFAPWLEKERADLARIDRLNSYNRNRKSKRLRMVKLGHGGTLDPMATGVLIVGVGNGTKALPRFLGCTKTYEATVLFGAATDTYDVMGKVLAKAPYGHVTRQKVEDALAAFRGKIMQRPPIYSALRVEGKRLYEYAREGKELPKEIQERPMEVTELEIMEWLDPTSHDYKCPSEEAGNEEKQIAEAVLHLEEVSNASAAISGVQDQSEMTPPSNLGKRKRIVDEDDDFVQSTTPVSKRKEEDPSVSMSGALQSLNEQDSSRAADAGTTFTSTDPKISPSPTEKGPPAVKLRMTVTSGFYVRSLSHDLGKKVGSLATMCELVRTRQGDFRLGDGVLEYEDIKQSEDVWGPQVERMLDEWEKDNSELRREASPNP
jgi:tRNA pseudouridine55 synthase